MLSNHIVGLPKGGLAVIAPSDKNDASIVIITGKLVFDSIMSKAKAKR